MQGDRPPSEATALAEQLQRSSAVIIGHYPLGREHLVNLQVVRARIFVYYIRYTNVRASIFGPIEPSAQTTRVAHVQRDRLLRRNL
jgi:hypothetical protein